MKQDQKGRGVADAYWPDRREPNATLGTHEIDKLLTQTKRMVSMAATIFLGVVLLLLIVAGVALFVLAARDLPAARPVMLTLVLPALPAKALPLLRSSRALTGGREPSRISSACRRWAAAVRMWWITR